jgi:hypothetical protein
MNFTDNLKNRLQKKGLSEKSIQNRITIYYRFSVVLFVLYVVIISLIIIQGDTNRINITLLILLLAQLLLSLKFVILFRNFR